MTKKDLPLFNLSDLYNQILERMPVHVYSKNTNFEYLACNPFQARNVGLASPDEIVGKT